MNNTFLKINELTPAFSMKNNVNQMGTSGLGNFVDHRRASVPVENVSAVESFNDRTESLKKTGMALNTSLVRPGKKPFFRNRHSSIATNNQMPSLIRHQRFNSELQNYPAKVHEGRESSPYIQARKDLESIRLELSSVMTKDPKAQIMRRNMDLSQTIEPH